MIDARQLTMTLGLNATQFNTSLNMVQNNLATFQQQINNVTTDRMTAALEVAKVAAELVMMAIKRLGETVNDLDKLNDAAQRIGSTASELSKLEDVAKKSGVAFEKVVAASEYMISGLAGTDEKAKGVGRALEFLGVSATDSSDKAKNQVELYKEVAVALEKYQDGAGKTAIVQDLMGTSGTGVIAFLKEFANTGTVAATVTDEQIRTITELKSAQANLSTVLDNNSRSLAIELAPTLTIVNKEFAKMLEGTQSVGTEGKSWLVRFIEDSVKLFAQQIDKIRAVIFFFKSLGAVIAGLAIEVVNLGRAILLMVGAMELLQSGDIKGFEEVSKESQRLFSNVGQGAKEAIADIKQFKKEFDNTLESRFDKAFNPPPMTLRQFEVKFDKQQAEENKPVASYSGVHSKEAREAEEAAKRIASLNKSTKAYIDQQEAISKKGKELTQAETIRLNITKEIEASKGKISETAEAELIALGDKAVAIEKANQAQREQLKLVENAKRDTSSLENQSNTLKEQLRIYGMLPDAIAKANLAKAETALLDAKAEKQSAAMVEELEKQVNVHKTIVADTEKLKAKQAQSDQVAKVNSITASIEAQSNSLQEQIRLYGLLPDEVIKANIVQTEAAIKAAQGNEALTKSLNEQLEAYKALQGQQKKLDGIKAADEVLKQQQAAWEKLGATVEGFFTDLIQNGKSAFGNLWKTVKQFFAQLAAQFATKFVINTVLGGNYKPGTGSPLDMLESMMRGTSKTEGDASKTEGGAGGSLFSSIGSLFTGKGSFADVGASIEKLFSAGGAGPVAIVAAIAGAIGKAIGGGFEIFKGSSFLNNFGAIGGLVNRLFGRKLKDSGIEGTFTGSSFSGRSFEFYKGGLFRSDKTVYKPLEDEFSKGLSDAAKAIFGNLGKLGKTLGLDTSGLGSVTSSFKISTKGLSEEQIKAEVEKQLGVLAVNAANALDFSKLDQKIADYIRSFSGSSDELLKYVQRVAAVKPIFDSLSSSIPNFSLALSELLELSDTEVQSLSSLGSALPALTVDAFAEVERIMQNASKGTVTRFDEMGSAVSQMVSDFSAGKVSIEQLAKSGADFVTAFAAASAKIAETQRGLDELFASTREGFVLNGMDTEQKYQYFQERAEALAKALETAIDPEQIDALTRQILGYQSQASGLLTDEERKNRSPEFLAGLDRVKAIADERLAAATQRLNEEATPIKDQIAEALAQFIEEHHEAAAVQLEAAETNLQAAQTPRQLEISVRDERGGITVRESGA